MTVRDLINQILDRSVWEYVFAATALVLFIALINKTEEVENEILRLLLLFLVTLLMIIVWYAGYKYFG